MTWLLLFAGLAAVAIFVRGFLEARRLQLTEAELPVPDLPARLEGLRILHLSDLHLSREDGLVERIAGLAGQARADVVFITGDIVHTRGGMKGAGKLLTRLSSLAPVFVAPGNSDNGIKRKTGSYPVSDAAWLVNDARPLNVEPSVARVETRMAERAAAFAESGRVEESSHESTSRSASHQQLWIAGVDDPYRKKDDLPKALTSVPEGAFLVLLSHSPDIILREGARRANVIFAGHTHGGQVRFPVIGAIFTHTVAPRRFSSGVHTLDGCACGERSRTVLVVSRGAGTTRLPIRLLCPPEATVWTLTNPSRRS
jgi:hypothetical protein